MATRINTKFVITLVSVIVLLVLGLLFAMLFLKKTAEDHINLAEEAMVRAVDAKEQGDVVVYNSELRRASKHYGMAKDKDANNTESLYGFIASHDQYICSNLTTAGNELDAILAGGYSLHNTPAATDDDRKFLYEMLHEHARMQFGVTQSPVGALLKYSGDRLDISANDKLAKTYHAIALGHLARTRTKQSEIDEDLETLNAAVEADPNNPWLHNALARYNMGNAVRIASANGNQYTPEVIEGFMSAYDQLNQSLELAKDNAPAYLEAIELLSQIRTNDEEKVAELNKRIQQAVVSLDVMLAEKANRDALFTEELAKAVSLISRNNLKADEDGAEAFVGRTKALALAEQVTKDRPEEPNAFRVLGQLQEQSRLTEEASATLKKGLAIDRLTNAIDFIRDHQAKIEMMSQQADLKITLGLRSGDKKQRDAKLSEASAILKELSKTDMINPDQAVVRDARVNHLNGRIALAQGNPSLAVVLLDQANQVYKDKNVDTLRLLAKAHAQPQLNNTDLVVKHYEAIFAVSGARVQTQDLLVLINLYLSPGENQQLERAENLLDNYQKQSPDDINGIRLRARLLQFQNKNDEALAMLQEHVGKHEELSGDIATIMATGGDTSQVIAILRQKLSETPEGEQMNLRSVSQLLNLIPAPEDKKAELERLVQQGLDKNIADILKRVLTSGKQTLEDELAMVKLLQTDPVDLALQNFLTYRKWGKEEEGRTHLDKAIELAPDRPIIIEWKYKLALDEKRWEDAQQAILEMLALPANERTALAIADGKFMRAQVLAVQAGSMQPGEKRNKAIREAIVAYNNALDEYSHYIEGWIQLGRLHLSQENFFAAQDSLQEALSRQSQNPTALELLAMSQAASGDQINALENFEQVVQIQPNNANALNRFTALAQQLGMSAQAVMLREKIRDRVPGNYDNRRALAMLYARTNAQTNAKNAIQSVIEEEGSTLQNIAVQCEVLTSNGEDEAAIKVATDYLAARGEEANWKDFLLLAQVYESAEDASLADQSYKKSIEMEKAEGTISAAAAYGQTLLQRGQLAEAAKLFEGMIEEYPENHTLKRQAAEIYISMQNYDKGEAIAKLMPASSDRDRLLIRSASLQQGKLGIAIERAKKAAEAYPSDFPIRLNLVELLRAQQDRSAADKRDYKNVLAMARELVKDNPDRVEALIALADLQLRMNENQKAAVQLEKAVAFAPRHFGANQRLAQVRLTEAAMLAVRDPEASKDKAREALAILTMLLEPQPENAGLLLIAARAAEASGLPGQALDYYGRAYEASRTEQNLANYIVALLANNQGANARAVIEDPANGTLLSNSLYLRALRGRALAAAGQPVKATNVFSNLLKEIEEPVQRIVVARQVAIAFQDQPIKAVELLESTLGKDLPVEVDGLITDMLLARKEYELVSKRLLKYWDSPAPEARAQVSLLTSLALAQQESGQLTQAKATYDRVYAMVQQDKELATRSQRIQLLNNMAYLLADQTTGYQSEAVRYAEEAVRLMSDNDSPRQVALIEDTLGWAYHKAGQNDKAIETLKASIDRMPLVPNQLHLGRVYVAIGEKDNAVLPLQAAMRQARAQGDQKQYEEAKKYFDLANTE